MRWVYRCTQTNCTRTRVPLCWTELCEGHSVQLVQHDSLIRYFHKRGDKMEDERLLRLIEVQACWLGFLPWKSSVKISSTGFPLLTAVHVCQEFFHLSITLFIMVLLWFSARGLWAHDNNCWPYQEKSTRTYCSAHKISGSNLINLVFELRATPHVASAFEC